MDLYLILKNNEFRYSLITTVGKLETFKIKFTHKNSAFVKLLEFICFKKLEIFLIICHWILEISK